MALVVKYLRGTKAQYDAYLKAGKISDYYYYLIINEDKSIDVYLGKIKLSNDNADLTAAIESLNFKNVILESQIEDLSADIETLKIDIAYLKEREPTEKEVLVDNKSIVNNNSIIKLYGFETAAALTYPRKTIDEKIEWVTIKELVDGASENTITIGDNLSIENVATDSGYVVKLKGIDTAKDGQVPFFSISSTTEGEVKTLIWKDVYIKDEIDFKIKLESERAIAAEEEIKNNIVALEVILNGTAEDESIGLISKVITLQNDIDNLNTELVSLKAFIENNESGLIQRVSVLEENTYTKAETDTNIEKAISWLDMNE